MHLLLMVILSPLKKFFLVNSKQESNFMFFFTGDTDCQIQLRDTMMPVLQKIHTDINKSNLINLPIYILPSIQLFASELGSE